MAERESGGEKEKKDDDAAAKKNESRLGQSPLNSSGKEKKPKKPAAPKKVPVVRIYQPPKTASSPKNSNKDDKKEEASGGGGGGADESQQYSIFPTIITFGSIDAGPPPMKTPPPASSSPNVKEEKFVLSIETIMSAAKPFLITVTKDYTIGYVRQAIKSKYQARHFKIFVDNKELGPDDSTLESNGIVSDTKIRLHIKTQSGTSDKEDISSIIHIQKSMNDLKMILSSMNSTSREPPRSKQPQQKIVIEPEKKAEEDQKSRDKMAKIREKFSQRNPKPPEKKAAVKGKEKTRRDGGIAGQYALPAKSAPAVAASSSASSSSSDPSNNSMDESLEQKSTTTPIVSSEYISNELFEPPDSKAKWEEVCHEFRTARCGWCRSKLPLIHREMPCRCGKVFCQAHRLPSKHGCSVDLKKLDRTKLEKELPKASSRANSRASSRKNSDEDLDETPKSSSKKLH